jgi:glycosyltransferase involved in cell wall biosynthesis
MARAPVILILASGQLCRAPRVLKEAAALGGAGYDVTVMTVADSARFEAMDQEILRTAPFRKVTLDMLSRTGVAGARVFQSRLATLIARRVARFGLRSKEAFGPARALGRLARGFEADLTIVHTEMPFCIGCDLLARGRRVAADFEDWHSESMVPEQEAARPMPVLRKAERILMQRAAYKSTTSHAMAKGLQAALGGSLPVVISNSFPLQPEPPPRPPATPPSFLWFSQTVGPGRGLEEFLDAWRQTTHPSRLCLVGDISESYRASLLDRLPRDRRERLGFLPLTPPGALPTMVARHDIGLALEPLTTVNRDLTISNKILQYLNAGLAVVATPTAGQREVLERAPGAGLLINLSQAGEAAALLDGLLSSPARLSAMGRAARSAAIETYCWERAAPRLLETVGAALGRTPGLS